MSLTSFYFEPFYSLSEFHNLFDEAFDSRTVQGAGSPKQAARTPNPKGTFRPV